jgi:hypothetical protein
MAVSADQEDKPAIQEKINSQKLACQLCKAPLLDSIEVSVHVEPGTPERLRKLGYPPSSEYLKRTPLAFPSRLGAKVFWGAFVQDWPSTAFNQLKDFPDVMCQQNDNAADASNPEEKVGRQLGRIDLLSVHRRGCLPADGT